MKNAWLVQNPAWKQMISWTSRSIKPVFPGSCFLPPLPAALPQFGAAPDLYAYHSM